MNHRRPFIVLSRYPQFRSVTRQQYFAVAIENNPDLLSTDPTNCVETIVKVINTIADFKGHGQWELLARREKTKTEVAAEAESNGTRNRLREGQSPEAAQTVRLTEPAAATKTPEVNRTPLLMTNVYFVKGL